MLLALAMTRKMLHATLLIVALTFVSAGSDYTYTSIIWGGNSDFCLTVKGGPGAYANQAPIVLSKCTDKAQMWTVPKYGTTTGNIKPGDGTTNFCLDGKDVSLIDSKPNDVWLWECNGYPWQQWYAFFGTIYINSVTQTGEGLCLTVPASTEVLEGAQVVIDVCNHPPLPNQKWGTLNPG